MRKEESVIGRATSYQKFLVLLDEYASELRRRVEGEETTDWQGKPIRVVPNNKERLRRLRIELSHAMLEMERKMSGYSRTDTETWY